MNEHSEVDSFEDSEQFELDSVCSWNSDAEEFLFCWSGWKQLSPTNNDDNVDQNKVLSLVEHSARVVGLKYAFETVDQYKPHIPEALQLRIAFWSFPQREEEIRLYSCLSCGSNDKYNLGLMLVKRACVAEVIQIGFHLSGLVTPSVHNNPLRQPFEVAVTFDRGHITSCYCTCDERSAWCEHVIAVCLYRITRKDNVSLRVPVSESLLRLERGQLQKFAQYLINQMPQKTLPTAQRLLDELLLNKNSSINKLDGAPDPTSGGCVLDEVSWVFDESTLCTNIEKVLAKFCTPSPLLYLNCDAATAVLFAAPPVSLQWTNYVKAFHRKNPEALWNLLSIARHMFAENDSNAYQLMECIMLQCRRCYQMMNYWVMSYINVQSAYNNVRSTDHIYAPLLTTDDATLHMAARFMEEVVLMWELMIMSPFCLHDNVASLKEHIGELEREIKATALKGNGQGNLNQNQFQTRMEKNFTGCKPLVVACLYSWKLFYEVVGITADGTTKPTKLSRTAELREMEVAYNKLIDMLPVDADEISFVCKLAQALIFHGFKTKGAALAEVCARKIIMCNPEELHTTHMTVKISTLCDMLHSENGKLTFDLAMIGLTFSRSPSKVNKEEMKLLCLEMDLYMKLKSMNIGEYHLNVIRRQCERLIANPYMRGDAIVPLLIATFFFEVLCRVSVASTTLEGPLLTCSAMPSKADEEIGYKCAIVAIGLCSSAIDQHHPMLCESMRHQRRDLVLALLVYCHNNDDRMSELLAVLLDKDRYSFINQTLKPVFFKNSHKKGITKSSRDGNPGHSLPTVLPKTSKKPKRREGNTSDSDSGHGEASGKQKVKNLPTKTLVVNKKPSQKRASRQFPCSSTRSEKSCSSRQSKTLLTKKNTKKRPEFTESDSGQEMNFSFDTDAASNVLDRNHLSSLCNIPQILHIPDEEKVAVDDDSFNIQQEMCESKQPNVESNSLKDTELILEQKMEVHLDKKKVGSSNHSHSSGNPSSPDSEDALVGQPHNKDINRISQTKLKSESQKNTPINLSDLKEALIAINESEKKGNKDGKNKSKKNKKAKAKFQMDVQSIESEAYSLFELAKAVLIKACMLRVDEIHGGANRSLQIAAFQIALLSLNIHNCGSPNWFSRTYSSYVSWIQNQAVEIGSAALYILAEKWEDILTPFELIQLAVHSSRCSDSIVKRAAADLALACLSQVQSLSFRDIMQSISMCRAQNEEMLERACTAVESAGQHGGLQPEVLFSIAKEWHYLYDVRRKREGSDDITNNQECSTAGCTSPTVEFITPEQFVQEQMHQQAQEILGRQLQRNQAQDHLTWMSPQIAGPLRHCPLPQQLIHSRQNIDLYNLPTSSYPEEMNLSEVPLCLQNSYRVGMKALEALAQRMPDDRPEIKFAFAPSSSEDIRWMCALAASLGPPYLKNFCKVVYNAVTSPFLLHDLALEAARHFAFYNPAQLPSHLRSPSVSPIVQKSLSMFTELVHHDLAVLNQNSRTEFVELLRRTRSAFCMAPGGMTRFNEILETIKKTYPKKNKDLWQLIMNGLSKA